MILAGDIGGTKTNIAMFASEPGARPQLIREQSYASSEHTGLEQILTRFLAESPNGALRSACFGIAGPVIAGRCETPNLPWVIEAKALQEKFGLPHVTLINDLEALAEGIPALQGNELATLNPGTRVGSDLQPGAVIAAGTGLGMAILQPVAGQWIPAASEGGHMDFAPRNPQEMALLGFLLSRFEHVSTERVVSGPGLHAVYDFLVARGQLKPDAGLARSIASNAAEAPALISNAALAKQCPVCVSALDLWVECYAATAGNLGLLALSAGGLYLGGGIAPKILSKLQEPAFLNALTSKGRLSPVLQRMPVHVILNPKTPLLGAARRALRS
ncbi:MAG TPA: glucokinase [Polyangiaceae bacterium]|nr:glucokinase [Polyangiaceae bacterium]